MDIILEKSNRPLVEHLVFEKKGRAHKHREFESFYVISGKGQVVSGKDVYDVREGSLITIPPETFHWMIPLQGQLLEGFLWYHEKELDIK